MRNKETINKRSDKLENCSNGLWFLLTMNPQKKFPSIEEVVIFSSAGPWKTKSGGKLSVLFSLPYDKVMQSFLSYDQTELKKLPVDICGLRCYKVSGLKKGSVGGLEFHKVRKEPLFALQGSICLELADIYRQTKKITLTKNSVGVYIPPFITHTYKVLEDNTTLVGIANTLFFPDNKETHDTYSEKEFWEIQKSVT